MFSAADKNPKNSIFGIIAFGSVDERSSRDIFHTAPVRVFDKYVLSHIYAGEGRLRLEKSKIEMRIPPGNIVIIEPGEPNIYGGISEDNYREDYIIFSGWEADRLAAEGLLKTGCYSFFRQRRLPEILSQFLIPSPAAHLRGKIMLKELLLEIHAIRRKDRYSKIYQLLEEFRNTPEKQWDTGEMAAFCQSSTAQFRRNFVACTGMLPKECIEGIKLQLAAEKLIDSTDSIDNICRRLGYDDRFHFSRRFSKFFGLPPGEFRKNATLNRAESKEQKK